MGKGIRRGVKREVLAALRGRYREASKQEKGRILDEFVALARCHRKHAIRLLAKREDPPPASPGVGRRVYDEAVQEALIVVWEAADRICGKRLKMSLPTLVDAMERHGHLTLDPGVRDRLFRASAATIDRLLARVRGASGMRRKRRDRPRKPSGQIAVRTFVTGHQT